MNNNDNLNNTSSPGIQQEYRVRPQCKSKDTFVKEGNVCWACLIPLTGIQIHSAESTKPPVSTSHKSTRLCRIADWEFILPSFVFLPFGEDRFCPLAQNAQKSLPLSQPVIEHYSSPSECSLTPGQRASKHPACPGPNNRPVRHASLNQQLVN